MEGYQAFLAGKARILTDAGFAIDEASIHPTLYPFQRDIVRWALRRGTAAIFADCGLGKTFMQLEWARHVVAHTGGKVLILAPLAVTAQTAEEGARIGVTVTVCRTQADVRDGVNIVNYDRLGGMECDEFAGVVLDESSILKNYTGATRNAIIETFRATPYKLACTATPAPNDYTELGNHAEFLGVMSRVEMLSMFFVHDGGSTADWRIKGHAVDAFWAWVCSWGVVIRSPADLGYDASGFVLPPMHVVDHIVDTPPAATGMLFADSVGMDLNERRKARRGSLDERVEKVAALVNASHGHCELTGSRGIVVGCGSQSMQRAGGLSINQTPESERGERASRARQRKTSPTCETTTQPTKTDTPHIGDLSLRKGTLEGESDTPPTLSIESGARSRQEDEIARQGEPPDSNHSLGSTRPTTKPCSHPKVEGAPSVNRSEQIRKVADFTLTTATQQERFEGSCAQTAISVSGSSETIATSSIAQPPTLQDPSRPWVIWCGLNSEQDELVKRFGDRAISIEGSMSPDEKTDGLRSWLRGDRPILISKPSIFGFGINMQHCADMAFCGMSDSYEAFYQAVRRCWRFGQTQPVNVHVVVSEAERVIVDNVKGKEQRAEHMAQEVSRLTAAKTLANLRGSRMTKNDYETDTKNGPNWTLHLGDCVETVAKMADDSIGYSVFSPPFASLYTYSASDRDMGNSADGDEFAAHFRFLVDELLRVTKPGRLLSFHCMNLPTSKARDGIIGIRDFRGELIAMFVAAGWIYHSEVCIWKDPVTAMQRTKALGLLHKQIRKDSCMSRQGIADYVVTMRKPGANVEPVSHTHDEFPVSDWQRYASPVWMDIDASDTLQASSAREDDDERHICPLQLEVIRRCLRLWSKPGDLVLSPFAGIGSEGYEAVKAGRRFVGVELKRVYWEQACRNLDRAELESRQGTLFGVESA